jgi:hypothetical protein
MTYIKSYMKAVKAYLVESNPDRVPILGKKVAVFDKEDSREFQTSFMLFFALVFGLPMPPPDFTKYKIPYLSLFVILKLTYKQHAHIFK